ncbi:MAG: Rpn family recombination-promoting nuclease/putative transposase, partial [Spirochaetia bacterium]|nr:Rpn family recombination-promoting nuclease/putative transposase [Spirochaetia bacterium]
KITTLLQLEKIELTKESFIGKEHEESRTDLLYKVPLKSGSSAYIYLLFEHKSYYDPKLFTQLLEYLSKIYSWQTENQEEFTIVIPFVFYHGEKGWDLGNELQDRFPLEAIPKELHRYIPNFPIQLFELKSKGEPFQTSNHALRLYMRLIQIIRDIPDDFKIRLRDIYISLREEKDFAKRIEILRNLLEYLNRARTDAEIYSEKEIIQGIEVEYMNVLDKIREEGKVEGKLEGELKKALETAQKMQKEGESLQKIIQYSGLSEDQLQENGIL